jgi:hypothetical protein
MCDTTTNENNGAHFPRFLVHLCHNVEVGKGIGNVERVVLLVFATDDMTVGSNEVGNHFIDFLDGFVVIIGGELAIGGFINKVV